VSVVVLAPWPGPVSRCSRYVLPVVVALPLLAGELVFRNSGRLPILCRIPLLALVTVVAAAGHFAG